MDAAGTQRRRADRAALGATVLAIAVGCGGDPQPARQDSALTGDAADTGAPGQDSAAGDDGGDGQPLGRHPPCEGPADCGDTPGPCLGWVCDSLLGCRPVLLPTGSPCVPGDPCAIAGSCDGAACVVKTAKDCDDSNPCTADACAGGSCASSPIGADPPTVCDDGDPCSANDACAAGSCVGPVNVCLCTADADCKDKSIGPDGKPNLCLGSWYCAKLADGARKCVQNPATIVACDASADTACHKNLCDPALGACAKQAFADGKGCDDGDACTAGEVCTGGSCGGGTAICCQTDGECVQADDGDLCNGTMFCNKATGKCQHNPATAVSCPTVFDTTCSQTVCDPAKGACKVKWTTNGESCDDGNPCTPGEACQDGVCAATATNTCACKVDADCAGKDDGDVCNGTSYCDLKDGTCKTNPATVVTCATVDDSTCSKNTCQPKDGSCKQIAVFEGTACDADGSPCTPNDACKAGACVVDSVNTCVCTSNTDCAAHDDGDLCNGSLYCDKGSDATGHCVVNPATIPSCPSVDNTACHKSICQAKTGKCAMTFVHQGLPCDDGDVCTKGDTCTNGVCAPGGDVCLCHKDQDCLPQEDGNVCNGTLYCDKTLVPWACSPKPSTVITCPDVNDSYCQQSQCQPQTGLCKLVALHIDEPCDDGDTCTVNTVCKGGLCSDPLAGQGGKCNDGNPCTTDSCDKALGCQWLANTGPCDDGDLCTTGDVCANATCTKGKPASCDDGNACTTDLCAAQTGCIHLQNASGCSDNNACSEGDACKAGACTPGTLKDCSDSDLCNLDSCDAKTGACSHDAQVDASKLCDDGVACTIDSCHSGLGCQHTPAGGACDDGIACTLDTCHAVSGCGHLPDASACSDGKPCTQDACVAGLGCQHPPRPDGESCDDGDVCSIGDTCKAGACVPGAKVPACTVDPAQCKGKADGTACNDGNTCSKNDACLGGVCAAKVALWQLETIAQGSSTRDGPRVRAEPAGVQALARLPSGAVAFASANVPAVRVMELDGSLRTLAGNHLWYGNESFATGKGSVAQLGEVVGLAVGPDGSLYGTDGAFHVVFRVDASGTVSLVAGGVKGHADGKGAMARFSTPRGLDVASDGSVVVADRDNYVIRKIAADGSVTTLSGKVGEYGGEDGKAEARWHAPEDVARAPDGSFVIADVGAHTVRRLKADGSVITLAGGYTEAASVDGKGAAARFYGPSGVEVLATGETLVAEKGGHRLRRVGLDGTVTTLVGSAGAGLLDGAGATAKVNLPLRLALDAFGDIIVADAGNNALRRLRLRPDSCDDGKPCTRDGCDPAKGTCTATPVSCSDDEPCTVDSCDGSGACVNTPLSDGGTCQDGDPCTVADICGAGWCHAAALVQMATGAQSHDDGPLATAGIYGSVAVRARGDGWIAVAETDVHRVRVISPAGVITTVVGATMASGYADGPAASARLSGPKGIAWASSGALWVAESGNFRVRKVTLSGTVSTVAGAGVQGMIDGAATAARFCHAVDLVEDAQGALVVADLCNYRLRKISAGAVTTFAGEGVSGWRDGTAKTARFGQVVALDRDGGGVIYAADQSSMAIRRIDSQGTVTTVAGGQHPSLTLGVGLAAGLPTLTGVAVGRHGRLWFASAPGAGRVGIIDPDGRVRLVAGGNKDFVDGLGPAASLGSPGRITALPDGRALLYDASVGRLRYVHAPGPLCDDAKACTVDACVAKLGCVHTATAAPCDDGDPCTPADTCKAGACQGGAKIAGCTCKTGGDFGCGDGNACTIDSCDAKTGCAHAKVADMTPCDDGSACTSGSLCQGGACSPDPARAAANQTAGERDVDGTPLAGVHDGETAGFALRTAGRLHAPYDLATRADGSVVIAAYGNHAIQVWYPDGRLATLAGAVQGAAGHRDGKASAAMFQHPLGVAVGTANEVYVADTVNDVIRVIATSGDVTTLAGAVGKPGFKNGKGSAAQFNSPQGMGRDAGAAVLVADYNNHAIRRVAVDGVVTTVVGNGTGGLVDGKATEAQLSGPVDVTVDSKGTIFIADLGNKALRRLGSDNLLTTVLLAGTDTAPLAGPGVRGSHIGGIRGIAAGPAGVAFVDPAAGAVRLLRPDSGSWLIAGGGKDAWGVGDAVKLTDVQGIAALPDGSWLVAQASAHTLVRLRPQAKGCDDGSACTIDACDGAKGCSHTAAQAAAVCPDGGPCQQPTCDAASGRCSYAAAAEGTPCGPKGDCLQQCLRGQCQAAALVGTVLGTGSAASVDGTLAAAATNSPIDACALADGSMAVLEYNGARLRRVDSKGVVTTLAGGDAGYKEGSGINAKFYTPHGIGCEGSTIWVADAGNHRIRKVDAAGNVSTIAGSGEAAFLDGPALQAKFHTPTDVVGAGSKVWVADSGSAAVRLIEAGKVSTVAGIGVSGGTADGPLGVGRLSRPLGLALDGKGALWIADDYGHAIRRLTPDGHLTTVVGDAASHLSTLLDGYGTRAPSLTPRALLPLADGSLLFTDTSGTVLRRVWPGKASVTVAGVLGAAAAVDGLGATARLSAYGGLAQAADGSVWIADYTGHLVRRVVLAPASCAAVAGSSPQTPAPSCALAASAIQAASLRKVWIDPDPADGLAAFVTTCDFASAGGGWTLVAPDVPAAQVSKLLAGKGRVLYRCHADAPHIVSPPTTAAWSWDAKTGVAGTWKVGDQSVVCGVDGAFGQTACGAGFGCHDAKAGVWLLPGMTALDQCAPAGTISAGGAMATCGAEAGTEWTIAVRAEK